MAPISFPRKGSRLLTLVPTFYVLKEQRGKRALVRASVWRFNGSSKGFAPARPQVVEQQTSGLAVLASQEGKGSNQQSRPPFLGVPQHALPVNPAPCKSESRRRDWHGREPRRTGGQSLSSL